MTTYDHDTGAEGSSVSTDLGDDSSVTEVPRFGRGTPVVATAGVFAVAIASWWLLADPKWSPTGVSSPVATCLLFWTIMGFIFTAFTFENWPFTLLRQPLAGLAQVVVNLIIGGAATLLFTRGLGHWDPTFSADAAGGAGYTASAFVVLIGFYVYSLTSASWTGYPFDTVRVPLNSVAQFFMAAFITLAGVLVLVYPTFSPALAPDAPVDLPTALGWVYSCIVVCIVAAMIWENWPWAGINNSHIRALAATASTLIGGVILYYFFRGIVNLVVPEDVKALPTFDARTEAAELGVCVNLWALTVGLLFGPTRLKFGKLCNSVVRTLIVLALAIVTYILFMRFMGTKVFHFPAVTGSYGGDPLLFVDWIILILLWYAVAFGKYGMTKKRAVTET